VRRASLRATARPGDEASQRALPGEWPGRASREANLRDLTPHRIGQHVESRRIEPLADTPAYGWLHELAQRARALHMQDALVEQPGKRLGIVARATQIERLTQRLCVPLVLIHHMYEQNLSWLAAWADLHGLPRGHRRALAAAITLAQ